LQGGSKTRRSRQHSLLKALEFQNLLDTKVVNNQADLAKRYGVSRARVTQHLNLLKLPDEIIDFLKENKDQESILRYFTERRLRDLTQLKGDERRMKEFRKMIEKAGFGSDC
jgi:ParB/RepB/Spo0J family partition protein